MTSGARPRLLLPLRSLLSLRTLPVLLALTVCACAADAVQEPEPSLETKGAFVAVVADGKYRLIRTLAVLGAGSQDEVLFVIPYAAEPRSFEEARELAKDPSLPAADVTAIGRRYFARRDWRVVWFRSVSAEEEALFR